MPPKPTAKLKSSISAFFPAYNDEDSIEKMVLDAMQALKSISNDFEVIVVDDGSPDKSGQIADRLAKKFSQVRVVHHKKNKGYGGALKSGFKAASKDLIFYTDGDGQYDAKELKRLIPFIERYDVVNGFKLKRSDSIARIVLGRLYHHGTKLFFGLKIRDLDCDFRLMHRRVIDSISLHSNSGLICIELMKKIGGKGFSIKEVGVHHYPRMSGSSQFFRPARLAKVLVGWLLLWWKLVLAKKLGLAKTD